MGVSALIAVACVAFAAVSGYALIPMAASAAHGFARDLGMRARLRFPASASLRDAPWQERLRIAATVLLEGGVPALSGAAARMLEIPAARKHAGSLASALRAHGVQAREDTVLQVEIPCALAAFAALSLLSGSALTGIALCAALLFALDSRARSKAAKAASQLDEQLPDALRALSAYYGSGLSLLQSLERICDEYPDPLRSKLAKVVGGLKTGMSVEQSLATLEGDADSASLAFLAVALEVQQRTGSRLQPMLESSAESIEAAFRLKRSLRVKTAQSRLSAKIVSAMPVCVFLMMAIASPSYIVGFLSSGLGVGLLLAAMAMEAVGIFLIRRILDLGLE